MRATASVAWWCGVVCALGALGLRADDPAPSVSFKLRAGIQVASKKDGLDNRLMGMGLELGVPAGSGRVFAELGYQYKSGTQFRQDLSEMRLATPSTQIDPDFSVDSVHNKLDGFLVRMGYGTDLDSSWSWKAGLQLGGARFTHSFVGYITDGQLDQDGALNNAHYLDTYANTRNKATVAVSPYVNAVYHVDPDSSFEFGVLVLGYKSMSYRHVAGTVTTNPSNLDGGHTDHDFIQETNRLVPHFEITYVFRF